MHHTRTDCDNFFLFCPWTLKLSLAIIIGTVHDGALGRSIVAELSNWWKRTVCGRWLGPGVAVLDGSELMMGSLAVSCTRRGSEMGNAFRFDDVGVDVWSEYGYSRTCGNVVAVKALRG